MKMKIEVEKLSKYKCVHKNGIFISIPCCSSSDGSKINIDFEKKEFVLYFV